MSVSKKIKMTGSNSGYFTFKKIKCLPKKDLVDMFSDLSADEMRRKFSFRCYLIPSQCSSVFTSYGNEDKARQQMKSHLLSHVSNINSEADPIKSRFIAESMPARKKRFSDSKCHLSPQKMVSKTNKLARSQGIKSAKSLPEKSISSDIKENDLKKSIHLKGNLTIEDIKSLPNKELLHFFSDLNADEMRRKYTFTCKIIPNHCSSSFISYGNRDKGQHQMFSHLLTHISEFLSEGQKLDYIPHQIALKVQKFKEAQKLTCSSSSNASTSSDESASTEEKFTPVVESSAPTTPSYSSKDIEKRLNPLFYVPYQESSQDQVNTRHDHIYASPDGLIQGGKLKHTITNQKSSVREEPVEQLYWIPSSPFPFVYVPVFPNLAYITEKAHDNFVLMKSDEIPVIADLRKKPTAHSDRKTDDSGTTQNSDLKKSKSSSTENKYPYWEKRYAMMCLRKLQQGINNKTLDKKSKWKCALCKDKYFTASNTLIYHYRGHAGIKPYTCEVCSATFTRQHSLNYHMLIHGNQSRFTCKECGHEFRHPNHYKEHLRRHTGVSPFECSECNQRFKSRNTYKRHLGAFHGKLLTAEGIIIMSNEDFATIRNVPADKYSKVIQKVRSSIMEEM